MDALSRFGVRLEDLDRDASPKFNITGFKDLSESAFTNGFTKQVAPLNGGAKDVIHGSCM